MAGYPWSWRPMSWSCAPPVDNVRRDGWIVLYRGPEAILRGREIHVHVRGAGRPADRLTARCSQRLTTASAVPGPGQPETIARPAAETAKGAGPRASSAPGTPSGS